METAVREAGASFPPEIPHVGIVYINNGQPYPYWRVDLRLDPPDGFEQFEFPLAYKFEFDTAEKNGFHRAYWEAYAYAKRINDFIAAYIKGVRSNELEV